ncbi:hypothetical protein V5O48_013367 [Marasmius crinis-equi]|uniref:Protein kinase domain-containing protein n=1 Tax=Marasmius crinis-equi TaxID=585013 RepID=A0ABR3F0A8_9AGAR
MALTLDNLGDEMQKELNTLRNLLKNPTERKSLLERTGDEAQRTLDMLQLLADFPTLSCPRSLPLKMMSRLSKKSGHPPPCLIIRNIEVPRENLFGGGGFADLYRGVIGSSATDRIEVAVKIVRSYLLINNKRALLTSLREAIFWRQLKHPNVLPFLGMYYLEDERKNICLVSPFMENGNLHTFLQDEGRRRDVDGQILMYDIASGLEYLHDEDIIHGDLKELNILVRKDCRACICDFGSSRLAFTLGLGHTTSLSGGTFGYIAPEILLSKDPSSGSSKKGDVYAYGALCFGILRRLYDLDSHLAAENPPPPRPESLPADKDHIWILVHKCWQQKPSARPTAADIVLAIVPKNVQVFPAPQWNELLYTTMQNNVDFHPLYARQPASSNYSHTTLEGVSGAAITVDAVAQLTPSVDDPPQPASVYEQIPGDSSQKNLEDLDCDPEQDPDYGSFPTSASSRFISNGPIGDAGSSNLATDIDQQDSSTVHGSNIYHNEARKRRRFILETEEEEAECGNEIKY